jgi:hypothetical protein
MATLYEDEEDDDDSRDDPQESDQDPGEYDDGVEEIPCPYCGELVYEQAELCPHCHSYISREDAPPGSPGQRRRRVPVWMWIGAALVMAAVVTWVVKSI